MGTSGQTDNYAPLRVKKKPNLGEGLESLADDQME